MNRYLILLIFLLMSSSVSFAADEKLNIFVSIPSQKYLMERVGDDRVGVSVMVKPGQRSEIYDPAPKQLNVAANTSMYFRIAIPFEDHWIDAIVS